MKIFRVVWSPPQCDLEVNQELLDIDHVMRNACIDMMRAYLKFGSLHSESLLIGLFLPLVFLNQVMSQKNNLIDNCYMVHRLFLCG